MFLEYSMTVFPPTIEMIMPIIVINMNSIVRLIISWFCLDVPFISLISVFCRSIITLWESSPLTRGVSFSVLMKSSEKMTKSRKKNRIKADAVNKPASITLSGMLLRDGTRFTVSIRSINNIREDYSKTLGLLKGLACFDRESVE
jgi:hypothetical protein